MPVPGRGAARPETSLLGEEEEGKGEVGGGREMGRKRRRMGRRKEEEGREEGWGREGRGG